MRTTVAPPLPRRGALHGPTALRHLPGPLPPRRGEPDAGLAARPRARRAPRPARLRRGLDRRAPLGGQRDHRLPRDLHRGGRRAHQRIKLGTGVTSIAYHNPLWVAERMVLLDHLTRGRAMLGCGPGSLPTDSMMLGLNPTPTRESCPRSTSTSSCGCCAARRSPQTKTHTLIDARLHLRPYTQPCFDVAVAAVASPPGRAWPARTASACSRSARP